MNENGRPSHAPSSSWRAELIPLIVIAFASFVARLAMVVTAPIYPLFTDMQEYWERAVYIAENAALYPNSWRMPGYPAALALVFNLTSNRTVEIARLFNAASGTLTALLTYWLARRTSGIRASLLAALVVAFYPSFMIYTTYVATESLVTVPLLGALIAVTYRSRVSLPIAGVCAALTTLVRPAGLSVLPAVLVAAVWPPEGKTERSQSIRNVCIVAVMFALTMAPWWMHNFRLHSRFVPFDTTGGYNLLIGNASFATGIWEWRVVEKIESDLLKGVNWQAPTGADTATSIALAHIRSDPSLALRRVHAKMAALVAIEGREHAYLYSRGYLGQRDPSTVWAWSVAMLTAFPLLATAAIVGALISSGVAARVLRPSTTLLAATALLHALTFGDPRFHIPVVPVLAVLATAIGPRLRRLAWWRICTGAIILAFLIHSWRPQLSTYLTVLPRLVQADGWNSQLFIDDLLYRNIQ